MPDDAGITGRFYRAYLSLLSANPDEVKKVSESKEASSIAQANVRLSVALGERMDALAKDPNWKGVDEMNDPASPFNLANLKQALTNQAREFCYQFDANGQLVTWAKGERGRVRTYNLPGMLVGGVDVHNHPSEEGSPGKSGRPFGWTFSDADFLSYRKSGVAVGLVYSREGEYRMDFPPEYSKRSRYELESSMAVYNARFTAIQQAAQRVLYDAAISRPDLNVKSLYESVNKMAGVMMLGLTEDTCAKLGVKFTFTPNKGYEDWKPTKVDLGDAKAQQGLFGSMTKPSPEFKILNGRKPPHLTTFTAPPVVTARGYTIGEAKDVKAPRKPRKPREPKTEPTQSTQPNNNYYRL
jgi:hypothetical protein